MYHDLRVCQIENGQILSVLEVLWFTPEEEALESLFEFLLTRLLRSYLSRLAFIIPPNFLTFIEVLAAIKGS